jgi:hypothetical protein
LERPVGDECPADAGDIPGEPAALAPTVEAFSNERIEADARDVREQSAIDLAEIDGSRRRSNGFGDCALGPKIDAELSGKPVAGARRDNPERYRLKRQSARDFIQGPVPAPGENASRSADYGRVREFARVAASLRNEHVRPLAY